MFWATQQISTNISLKINIAHFILLTDSTCVFSKRITLIFLLMNIQLYSLGGNSWLFLGDSDDCEGSNWSKSGKHVEHFVLSSQTPPWDLSTSPDMSHQNLLTRLSTLHHPGIRYILHFSNCIWQYRWISGYFHCCRMFNMSLMIYNLFENAFNSTKRGTSSLKESGRLFPRGPPQKYCIESLDSLAYNFFSWPNPFLANS